MNSCILKSVSGYDVVSIYVYGYRVDKYTEGSQSLKPLVQILTFCFRFQFKKNLSIKMSEKFNLKINMNFRIWFGLLL